MNRKEFLGAVAASAAAAGATSLPLPRQRARARTRRARHVDTVLYRGPFRLNEHVAEILTTSPGLCQTTHRKLACRYADGEVVYLGRTVVPEHRCLVGEVVRTQAGPLRVHFWAIADPGDYDTPLDIAAHIEGRA